MSKVSRSLRFGVRFGLVFTVVLGAAVLGGCQLINQILGNGGSSAVGGQLTISTTSNGTTTTYGSGSAAFDFGAVDPHSTTGTQASLTVKNTSSDSVSISSVSVDDKADYKFTISGTTIAPDASVTLTGIFTPQTNKKYPANVTITGSSGGNSGTLTFPVTGEGNYPPVVTFSVKVTAATSNAYLGTYLWDESKQAFVNGSYYIYADYNLSDSGTMYGYWFLGTDTNPNGTNVIDQEATNPTALPPTGGSPPHNSWSGPKITGLDDSAGGVYDSTSGVYDGTTNGGTDTISLVPLANVQSDADGDPAGTPTYQWQVNNGSSPASGTWTDVSGATSSSVTAAYNCSNSTHYQEYYRVIVTPTATSGIKTGTPTPSPPIIVFSGC